MTITTDFSIANNGDVRHVSGTSVYTVLELHQWLQDLADDAAAAGNDLLDILAPNPSKLDGPRDAAVASRLNLLTSGAVAFNIDDTAAQFINFGSIKQASAATASSVKTMSSPSVAIMATDCLSRLTSVSVRYTTEVPPWSMR